MLLRGCITTLLFASWAHLNAQYIINTFAGGGTPPPLPATSVGIGQPVHIAVDATGNIYISSFTQNRVLKVDSAGTLTVAVGNGALSYHDPTTGPALDAAIYAGTIALDPAGNLYLAGRNCCVVKISNGAIFPAVGNAQGFSGDGGPASSAAINPPGGMAFDSGGNLYISDPFTNRVRKISQGVISTVAGNGSDGFSGDGGAAVAASLSNPLGVAIDKNGNLYIADSGNQRIRKVANGMISTIAGGGTSFADGIPATGYLLGYLGDLAVDADGDLYIPNYYSFLISHLLKVSKGVITTVQTSESVISVAADNTGDVYLADFYEQLVRRLYNGTISTIAGNGDGSYIGDGTVATSADLAYPTSVAVDRAGNVFVADAGNSRIRRITGGQIVTVATTTPNPTRCASCPADIALDSAGNLYFIDGYQVRVLSNGLVATVAGNGSSVFSGDGGPATLAGMLPYALGVDSHNDLYIADANNRIRKVSNGVITTVVGNGTAGTCTSPGPATGASVDGTEVRIAIDSSDNIYYTNYQGREVCKVSNGMVTALASNLVNVGSVTLDQFGNVFIGDATWVLKLSNGVSNILAGSQRYGLSGDGGPGTSATLSGPLSGLAVDIAGNVYIADSGNNRIRMLSPTGLGNPIGSFDTPVDNTTGVAGAIPVTGWALDNVGISKVQVWREPVGNEAVDPTNHLVFVGNAVQVAGARPDVQAKYPNMPFNNSAGWGYLLLTNLLPSTSGPLGNGTYKLHFIAYNNAGASTDLGTHTITVDNVHASKPFGTIDTPPQGGTVSGNAYINFGWALTQNPYCIPTDGRTLTVTVDGVALGHPAYNQSRSDIATLFPGLCNSNGAVGFFYLDTTTLANGMHTIAWAAYDNQGRGDGLGSRYFTVQNTGSMTAPQETTAASANPGTPQSDRILKTIEVEELGHLELNVGATMSSDRLPVGSTLKDGVFYWQLGPGFLGEYQLRFVQPDSSGMLLKVKVRPKMFSRN